MSRKKNTVKERQGLSFGRRGRSAEPASAVRVLLSARHVPRGRLGVAQLLAQLTAVPARRVSMQRRCDGLDAAGFYLGGIWWPGRPGREAGVKSDHT